VFHLQVSCERTGLTEGRVTQQALVRLQPAVCPPVIRQRPGLTKGLSTQLALVRLIAGVGAPVVVERNWLPERLSTRDAEERPLVGVSPPVAVERRRLAEGAATHVAVVRPLAGMDARVDGQVGAAVESLAASLARMRPPVGGGGRRLFRLEVAPVGVHATVDAERSGAGERPIAEATDVGRTPVGVVRGPVPIHVALRGERLLADVAFVGAIRRRFRPRVGGLFAADVRGLLPSVLHGHIVISLSDGFRFAAVGAQWKLHHVDKFLYVAILYKNHHRRRQ